MSEAKGVLLNDLFESKAFHDVNKIPNCLIESMFNIVNELNLINLKEQKISGFGLNMSLMPMVRFGPCSIEPCNHFLDLMDKSLIWAINEMNKIRSSKKLANILESFRLELIQVVKQNNINLDNLNFYDKLTVCHPDLHPGIIFVDPITFQINSVIDWEWCY